METAETIEMVFGAEAFIRRFAYWNLDFCQPSSMTLSVMNRCQLNKRRRQYFDVDVRLTTDVCLSH